MCWRGFPVLAVTVMRVPSAAGRASAGDHDAVAGGEPVEDDLN